MIASLVGNMVTPETVLLALALLLVISCGKILGIWDVNIDIIETRANKELTNDIVIMLIDKLKSRNMYNILSLKFKPFYRAEYLLGLRIGRIKDLMMILIDYKQIS
jgi:hypothetical protein